MKYSKYNVVIIGSGLAGLYLANKLANQSAFQDGVLLVTKENVFSGSTSLAQGGMVSVIPEINKSDSIESHVKDTIKAGCGLNNINTVKFVSENSFLAAQELIRMGVEFDRSEKNLLNFTMEGAHSCPRILHAKGDSTGEVIEKTLCNNILNSSDIDIYTNTMAIDILVDNQNIAHGIIVYNEQNNSYEAIYSNNIVIATGGIGQIYKNTTNPKTSTADGIALAYKAGCEVENMEFVQFHPTGLYCKDKDVTPLISESVRGEGAKLVDINGDYFAYKYHQNADLAPRDIVARAIYSQMKLTNAQYVNLDISQIGIEKFKQRFPTITKICLENNIDLSTGLIPVTPVQHYFMGGIKTDINSKTSIENLYAIGECAMTGLHGANRLASNSLLECAVFAHNLATNLIKNSTCPPKKHDEKIKKIIDKYSEINSLPNDTAVADVLFNRLKVVMSKYVSIERNSKDLTQALVELSGIEKEANFDNSLYKRKYELDNALTVAKLITSSALKRETSIGAHFRSDSIETKQTKEAINIGNTDNEELLAR
ncbi:MAG: L-aspartate oxidase [Candidatus Gastranaerophilales bacterium]|nr:L-aspartate oxidase [Candidatus Gastranaerophilales bacterium]